jgi:hypothetical protein
MQNLIPRRIHEAESEWRAIKDGWYVTNETGQVLQWPIFESRGLRSAHQARANRHGRVVRGRGA